MSDPEDKKTSIVVSLEDQRRGPDRLAELASQARVRGVGMTFEKAETQAERKLREWTSDSAIPTIPAGDDRAFRDNLAAIAAGKIRVA